MSTPGLHSNIVGGPAQLNGHRPFSKNLVYANPMTPSVGFTQDLSPYRRRADSHAFVSWEPTPRFGVTADIRGSAAGDGIVVSAPPLPSYLRLQSHSSAHWLFPEANAGTDMVWGSFTVSNGGVEWSFSRGASAGPGFAYQSTVTIRGWYDLSAAALPLNEWTHVIFTWDKAAGDARAFYNGVLAGEHTTTATEDVAYEDVNTGLKIGNEYGASNTCFNGNMMDFRLYNRALSDGEAALLYRDALEGALYQGIFDGVTYVPAAAGGSVIPQFYHQRFHNRAA